MAKNSNNGLIIAKALMRQLISQTLRQQKLVKLASKAEQESDIDGMLEHIKTSQLVAKDASNTMSAIASQVRGATAD